MSASLPDASGLGTDELRAVVRAVLRDVLPTELLQGAATAAAPPGEEVTLRNDGDLDALVRKVASLCDDPARRAALKDGRHGFRLAAGTADRRPLGRSATPQQAYSPSGVVRIERGAVTERTVVRAAADGARLVVGAKAVLTPLARDKARVLGVEIEKER